MKEINFDTSAKEDEFIYLIAKRYQDGCRKNGLNGVDHESLLMDLTACHKNGCPLDLEGLSKVDDFNLAYDVAGIINHMNRETGKLDDRFLPRLSLTAIS